MTRAEYEQGLPGYRRGEAWYDEVIDMTTAYLLNRGLIRHYVEYCVDVRPDHVLVQWTHDANKPDLRIPIEDITEGNTQ